MKKILEFEEGDDEMFELHINGPAYSYVISDFMEYLRKKQKYENIRSLTIDEIRTELLDLLDSRDLTI